MKIFLLSIVSILITGCASTIEFPQKSGIYTREVILENNLKMRYTISVPETVSENIKIPLILALHYGGEVTPFYSKEYLNLLVRPALKKLEAIIAAPDCPGNGWANPEVESAVMEFLEIIKAQYNIDPNRIIITGYSMGGLGTWYLATRHHEMFSAAIPMSAIPDLGNTPVVKDLPFFVIHSRNDELLSIDLLKQFIQKYKSKGGVIKFQEVRGIRHYDTYHFIKPLKEAVPWIKKIWDQKLN